MTKSITAPRKKLKLLCMLVFLGLLVLFAHRNYNYAVADFKSKPAAARVTSALIANQREIPKTIAYLPNGWAWNQAVKDLQEATSLVPDNAAYVEYLGLSYVARGRGLEGDELKRVYFNIAQQYLEQALALNPRSVYTIQSLILVRGGQGKHDQETQALLTEFMRLGPRENGLQLGILQAYAPIVDVLEPSFQSSYMTLLKQALLVSPKNTKAKLQAQAKRQGVCGFSSIGGQPIIRQWSEKVCNAIGAGGRS